MKTHASSLLFALTLGLAVQAQAQVTAECTPTISGAALPDYLDLKKAVAVVGSSSIDVTLYLRGLPATLPINRFINTNTCSRDNPCYSEYAWGVTIGADGTIATDSSGDYFAQVNYLPRQDAPTSINTASFSWSTYFGAYQVDKNAYYSDATVKTSYVMDPANGTVKLTFPRPSISGVSIQPPLRVTTNERDASNQMRGTSCALNFVNVLPQDLFSIKGTLADGLLQTSATGSLDTLTLSGQLTLPASGKYNVYVFGVLPGLGIFMLGQNGWQMFSGLPMQPYARQVDATSLAGKPYSINILSSVPVASLKGLEIYVGYGADDSDLLGAMRLRGIYRGAQ
jgi:hypothetical protein